MFAVYCRSRKRVVCSFIDCQLNGCKRCHPPTPIIIPSFKHFFFCKTPNSVWPLFIGHASLVVRPPQSERHVYLNGLPGSTKITNHPYPPTLQPHWIWRHQLQPKMPLPTASGRILMAWVLPGPTNWWAVYNKSGKQYKDVSNKRLRSDHRTVLWMSAKLLVSFPPNRPLVVETAHKKVGSLFYKTCI